MIEGVININKPVGYTSADVVAKLRRILNTKKIGHTGTLDPMATGVLPVCIGSATRLIEYYDGDYKTYSCTMQLGKTSDTLDSSGTILSEQNFGSVSESDIRECFRQYTGKVLQYPPKFSALKIDGKRAYQLAREGVDFQIKPRTIWVLENHIDSINLSTGTLSFTVKCSKGTYIRTMCDDIGQMLECGAIMTSLCRTASGHFSIDDAIGLDELETLEMSSREDKILPIESTLDMLGIVELDARRAKAFGNGMSTHGGNYRISVASPLTRDDRYAYDERIRELCSSFKVYSDGIFLGIATNDEDGELIPLKVIKQ